MGIRFEGLPQSGPRRLEQQLEILVEMAVAWGENRT
jgi:hypothetical protein